MSKKIDFPGNHPYFATIFGMTKVVCLCRLMIMKKVRGQ